MYLSVSIEGDERVVSFVNNSDVARVSPSEVLISPLFPVDSSLDTPQEVESHFFILFCYALKPYSTIGSLVAKLNDQHYVKRLWYSHGLASLIVVSPDNDFVRRVVGLIEDRILGWELWEVNDSVVGNNIEYRLPQTPQPIPSLAPLNTDGVSSDIQALVHQYVATMAVAMHRAASYDPENLETLCSVHDSVFEILNHLVILSAPAGKATASKVDEKLEFVLSDPTLRTRYVHTLTDSLLQINTYLDEIVVQGYAGVIPIFKHSCALASFSLLGVGNALKALNRIYGSVNKVFAQNPIPKTIQTQFEHDYSQIPIFIDYGAYDVEKWRDWSFLLDQKIGLVEKTLDDRMCHLMYFSSVLGFRETLRGISAASQCLYLCASPRWSLMTLTHEFLHAHVRALLSVLFPETPSDSFGHVYGIFEALSRDESVGSDRISTRRRLALIILSITLSMVTSDDLRRQIHSETATATSERSPDLSQEEFFRAFRAKYNAMNEYLVHTLDYLYFYGSDTRLYIQLIWLTWAAIPEIQELLEHYVLRTLLTVSVDHRGVLTKRFESAVGDVRGALTDMLDRGICENEVIIRHALKYLETEEKALKAGFVGAMRLADMAKCLLHSDSVHKAVMEDTLQGEEKSYPMGDCEFLDQDIRSPIAFIVDRTKRKLKDDLQTDFAALFRETCWQLLVLASADTTTTKPVRG